MKYRLADSLDKNRKLREAIASLKADNRTLVTRSQTVSGSLQTYRDQIAEKDAAFTALELEHAAALDEKVNMDRRTAAQVASLQAQIDSLQSAANAEEQQKADAERSRITLTEEVARLHQHIANEGMTAATRLQASEAEVTNLKKTLTSKDSDNTKRLMAVQASFRKEREGLDTEMERLRSRISALTSKLLSLEAEKAALMSKISEPPTPPRRQSSEQTRVRELELIQRVQALQAEVRKHNTNFETVSLEPSPQVQPPSQVDVGTQYSVGESDFEEAVVEGSRDGFLGASLFKMLTQHRS
ncbi:MAG: hypothetical protein KVP17_001273 [Porospora cf. gigantea B]|uniref:uncharacterized protein n=1 Tax=Porospora cf. gigantea B TaxID=2853592 RepID=UPI003571B1E6|nr:MAG: hypothetical protein KVP17_001273 [Porospora cf. gigantea B]